jgi:diaminohydroxyphosphoribosylaminopyrimidine deaminase / 5-amino-6-(5-phosphoribosylamino)uracil reductase
MLLSPLDETRLWQALALAEQSFGLTEPNPRVGCIIGHADGQVLAEGATQQAGGPHAEAQALAAAARAGVPVRGATAWVSLEPCAHHGRTPPCCDALIAAGIARVVVAAGDPFPQVNGAGLARLRAAGVDVVLAEGQIAQAARQINVGFFSRVQRGRPWVRLKLASSLDGRSALLDGRSQWITGEAARADGHAWRRRASAVLSGVGTVLADNPRLDVRSVATPRQPWRIVLDSRLRTPPQARLLDNAGAATSASSPVWILAAAGNESQTEAAEQALLARGARVQRLPSDAASGIDLGALLHWLAQHHINELHVEAGARLSGAWLASGWVDELLWYQAPMLIGPGLPAAHLPGLGGLDAASRWQITSAERIGADLRLLLRTPAAQAFIQGEP